MYRLLFLFLFLNGLSSWKCQSYSIDHGSAVWGARAPDYSLAAVSPGTTIFMRGIIFVDNKTTSFYEFDMLRVKTNIMKMIDEANQYLNQLSIGLVVVGIYQTNRGDLSLQSFQEYRNTRLHKLPEHDFATLITYKYAGGLAYVNGMCTSHSVSLSGFYPNEPRAMGSIFFHEIAHLVGVPHRAVNESIYVPNCACSPKKETQEEGCLRIPGFDHDCTVQQFANVVYKNKCLTKELLYEKSYPICGNGVVEEGEDCDCGLPARCYELNCQPFTCTYQMRPFFLVLIIISFVLFLTSSTLILLSKYTGKMLNCFKKYKNKQDRSSSPYINGQIQVLAASPYQSRKSSSQLKSNASSIIVSGDSRFATIQRPKIPPPPPPKTTINIYNDRSDNDQSNKSYRESIYDDFSDDDYGQLVDQPETYTLPTGVPTCPLYPTKAPINRVTVDLQLPKQGSTTTTTNSSSSFSL